MDNIFTRRSIRKYTDAPVDDDQVRRLLEAAMAAPSAGNEQPWHFVVIRDRQALAAVTEFHEYAGMLQHAPVAILVCGDMHLERYAGFWVQDCAAATQNLLLAADSLGLGAVWLGIHPIDARVHGMRRLCAIPEHVVPFALVALGHPAESKAANARFDDARVHRETWSESV